MGRYAPHTPIFGLDGKGSIQVNSRGVKLSLKSNASWHVRIQRSRGWSGLSLRELWSYRDLFWILAWRDVKLRYKQTALGVTWVILQPILTSGIFAVIFGFLAELPSDGSPYMLFAFAGTLPWTLFAQSLQRAGTSLVSGRELVSKVYFPRLILPIASSFSVLVDFLVGLASISVLFLIYQVPLTWNILAIPGLVLANLLIAVGVSFWVSAFSVHYRDFIYALPFLVQAWMYASPVAYASSIVPEEWSVLYSLNPMVGIIEGFRWSLLGHGLFSWLSIGISLAVGLLVFFSGALVFRRIERGFADVI
ncbi:MAG: ABC transporter permease [Chloroflexi bacterium]|nr:ABC transporter permease [Chloroflexota bacterium]